MTPPSSELIEHLDLEGALAEELRQMPDLLPDQIVDEALESDSGAVVDHFEDMALAGVAVEPAPKVVAMKWRYGRRAVAALPLYERVLYRAVVNNLADDLIPRTRGATEYNEFQRAPISEEGTRYVVMTDLANYYGSLDIDRLAQDLLRRAGRWAHVAWLRNFWTVTSDGFGGIPQMNTVSDVIADTYADKLHRRLLRSGLAVWRYADDFRIACRTYGECIDALELLDEAARDMGLSLNERKTLTPSLSKYEIIVDRPRRRLEKINEQVESELTEFDPYNWEAVTPEKAEVLRESASRVFASWAEVHNPFELDPETDMDLVQVIPQCIAIMIALQDGTALSHVPDLLRYEPQLTPMVARYARSLASSMPDEVTQAINTSLDHLALTRWQRLWLLHVMEDLGPTTAAQGSLLAWMRTEAMDPLPPLRCQAVWALARSRSLDLPAWEGVDAISSRYASPFAAASLPGVQNLNQQRRRSLTPTGRVEALVAKWSASTHFAHPF